MITPMYMTDTATTMRWHLTMQAMLITTTTPHVSQLLMAATQPRQPVWRARPPRALSVKNPPQLPEDEIPNQGQPPRNNIRVCKFR